MDFLNKKEGSFYSNKVMVVSVLLLIVAVLAYLVYATAGQKVDIIFTDITNGSYTADETLVINITFNATASARDATNVSIVNTSINVTLKLNGAHVRSYNFTNMSCQYYDDGVQVNESMICNVTTTALGANGTYEIVAYAEDNDTSANSVTSTINFTLYIGAPVVTAVTIVNGTSPLKSGTYKVSVTFDRKMSIVPGVNATIINVSNSADQYLLNITQLGSEFANTTEGRAVWNGTLSLEDYATGVFDGTFYINVSGARDAADNLMRDNNSVYFTFDSVAPQVELMTIDNINQSSLVLQFNFTDNVSTTAYCQLYLNGTLNATDTSALNGTATSISMSLPASPADATFNWTIYCNDTANNIGYAIENRTVNLDRTAPVISDATISPLNGYYIKDTGDIRITGVVSDAFTGVRNQTVEDLWIGVSALGIKKNFTISSPTNINMTGSKASFSVSGNLSKYFGLGEFPENTAIAYTIYGKDYAANEAGTSATFYIDNTAPTVGAPSLNGGSSYVQGENLIMTVQVNDTYAGVNLTNATLGINATAYVNISYITMTCSGLGTTTATCTYTLNTSAIPAAVPVLPRGNYRLNGTITAYDNTENLLNSGTATVALDFDITDAGVPTLDSVVANLTRVLKNVVATVSINVSVDDTSGIESVWATYRDNNASSDVNCSFYDGGGVTTTSLIAIGNCSVKANASSSDVAADNALTLTIFARDTTNRESSTTYTLKVENDPINVTAFSVPTKPFLTQNLTVNVTVFSWYGAPTVVQLNITNGTDSAIHTTFNTTCSAAYELNMYYCLNFTNMSFFSGGNANASTLSIVNASCETYTDGSLPTEQTVTPYTETSVNIDKIPGTSSFLFVQSGIKLSALESALINTSGDTQDIVWTDTTLNQTVVTLNDINISAITNFTLEIVPANSSGNSSNPATNWTYVQASLTTGTATLLTAIVLQPKINNVSTGFTGSTVAFNCTALGITCGSTTRVYTAPFNTTTNATIGTTWTVVSDANTAWSSPMLTVTVNSFSIFALATPVTAAAATTTTTSSSGGGGGGGISSISTTGVSKTQVWTRLSKGSMAMMNLNNDAIAFTQVKFTAQNVVEKPEMTVTSLTAKPEAVSDASSAVYQYLEIATKVLTDADVGSATINFVVDKDWFTNNGVSRADVVLLRYVGGQWVELPTTFVKEDGGVHYRATTPGFSYFAIGVKSGAVVTPPSEEETPSEEVTPPSEEVTPEEAKKMPLTLIIVLAVIVVILVVVYLVTKKKK